MIHNLLALAVAISAFGLLLLAARLSVARLRGKYTQRYTLPPEPGTASKWTGSRTNHLGDN